MFDHAFKLSKDDLVSSIIFLLTLQNNKDLANLFYIAKEIDGYF